MWTFTAATIVALQICEVCWSLYISAKGPYEVWIIELTFRSLAELLIGCDASWLPEAAPASDAVLQWSMVTSPPHEAKEYGLYGILKTNKR